MVEFKLLGNVYIIKILRAPRFKKNFTLATPPPWYKNPEALSKGQVAQVIRFSQVAHNTAGMRLKDRMNEIRARASGATGYAKPRVRTPLPKIGKLTTIAQAYGIPIPPELVRAPAPITAVAPPRGIRE